MTDHSVKENACPDDDIIECVANALQAASFGYSLQLTRLVDGMTTYTLTFDDGSEKEPMEFTDQDDAYAFIATEKRRTQARAAIAAIRATCTHYS